MRVRAGSPLTPSRRRPGVLPTMVASALVGSLLLGGCGADSGEARPQEDQADVDGLPVSTRVVFPGFGDLERLRYRFEKGEQVTWEMTVDLDTALDGQPSDLPPFTLALSTEVASSSQDETELMVSVDDVRVGDGAAPLTDPEQNLATLLSPMEGLKGPVVLGADGGLVRSGFVLPQKLTPALKITLSSLADGSAFVPPLPTEPVGQGAQWVASNTISLRGTTVDKQATYTRSTGAGESDGSAGDPAGDPASDSDSDSDSGSGFDLAYETEQGIEIDSPDGATSGTSTTSGDRTGSLTELGGSVTEGEQKTSVDLPQGEQTVVVTLDAEVTMTADPT